LINSLSYNNFLVHLVQEIKDKYLMSRQTNETLNTPVGACFTDNILLNLIDSCLKNN